jgi:hypothetical protein
MRIKSEEARRPPRAGWAVGVAAAFLGACASVTSVDGTRLRMGSDAFAAYVESVFRAQNTVATELAFALDEADPGTERFERLETVETELIAACAGLNELAVRRRDGRAAGGLRGAGAARSAPACERATRTAGEALEAAAPPSP